MTSLLDHIRCWYCFAQLPCNCACDTNDERKDRIRELLNALSVIAFKHQSEHAIAKPEPCPICSVAYEAIAKGEA